MEIKNKKIVAGMMAGFCVLSTQSVLGNFSKLPMRGGNGLISYATVDDNNGRLAMFYYDGCLYARNRYQGVTLMENKYGENNAVVPMCVYDGNGNRLYVTKVDRNAFWRWRLDSFCHPGDIIMRTVTIEGTGTVIEDGALNDYAGTISTISIPQNAQCRYYIERLHTNNNFDIVYR